MLIRFIYTFLLFNIIFINNLFALNADMQPTVFEDSNDLTPAGSIFYYHVKLHNNTSTDTNETVTLKVKIPIGFEYNTTNFPDDCDYSGATPSNGESADQVICEFSTFVGNSSKDINITVKAGMDKGVFKSIATAYYDGDVNNANDSENVKTTIVESADVELVSYEAPVSTIPSSGIVTYKMVVENHGPFDTSNINFETTLPTGLEFYADNAETPTDDDSSWSCSASGQVVTCNRGILNLNDTKTFYFRAKSNNGILGDLGQGASVTSDTTIIDIDLNNNIKDVNITIIEGTNVAIKKYKRPKVLLENEVATFKLNIMNKGYMDAVDVVVTDTIPDDFAHGLSEDNITAPANWNCTLSSATVTCSYDGNLTAGYDDNITIKTQSPDITDNQDHDYTNIASLTTSTTDTNGNDDSSTKNYTLWANQSNVTISKAKEIEQEHVDGNPIVVGQIAVSKIKVTNYGPQYATPLQIFDDLDDNETYVSSSGTDWNCSVSGQRVTCDYSQALFGESPELIIKTKANEDVNITNIASINNDRLDYPDLNTTDHNVSKGVIAKAYPDSADLEMNKDTNDTVITSDENGFEYYLDITNNGPATATNIKVIDKIPQYVEAFNGRAETTIIADSNSSDDYSCDVDGADVNCTLSKIDVNDTVRVRIGVYGAKATGVRINSATAFSTTIADSNRSNNEGNVSVDVQSTADVMVSKNDVTFASEDEFIYAGTNGLYTIQVINNGSAEAKDVNLTNKFIGEEFKIIEFSESNCTLYDNNRSFSCDLGDMAYKESRTINITIRPTHKLVHNEPWDINNSASVTMSTLDSNLSNNEQNETLPIKNGEVDISIEKDESILFIEPLGFDANDKDNNRIVYKITVTNAGPSEATNIKLIDKVIDVFPNNEQNMTFLGDGTDANGTTTKDFNMCVEPTNNNFNPNNTESTHEVNCSIPNIESGEEFVRYLTFEFIDAPHRVKGDVYHNDINVTTLEIEREYDNNHEDESTTVRTFVDLEIKKTASLNNVEVGQDFNFTFDIYNDGPGYATNTEVTDTLPDGMELIATPIVKDDNGSCSGVAGDTSFACDIGNLVDDGFLVLEDNKSIQVVAKVRVVSYPSSGQVINSTLVTTSAPDKNLTNNEDSSTVGVYEPAKIGNRVWLDKNADGIQDVGESGLSGIVVKLLDENKTLVTTTTTNSSGIYNFDINHTAEYFILVEPDSKYQISPKDKGVDDTLDSDINSSKITDKFNVDYADDNQSFDIGLYQFASLGDRVWLDNNGDGIQDTLEDSVADVNVTLYQVGNSIAIAQMETNQTGEYLFENLVPNSYFVKFSDINVSYKFTLKDTGDYINGSDVNATGYTDIFALESNEHNRSIDAGIFEPTSVGNRVWHDKNANGIQDGGENNISNVKIQLWIYDKWIQLKQDLDGNIFGDDGTITPIDGQYIFSNLKPDRYYLKVIKKDEYNFTLTTIGTDYSIDNNIQDSNSNYEGDSTNFFLFSGDDNLSIDIGEYKPIQIGGNVWIDRDYNGTQEGSEDNVSNVTVTLITDGTITATTTTTDSNGSYIFDNLLPNHTYGVEFSDIPEHYLFTKQDIGDDSNDSDANITTGRTIQTDIMYSGDSNLTLDAGIYNPIVIGDFVWEDDNYNGIQDSGENGVSGVVVKLVIDDIVQNDINTTTNNNGKYYFGRALKLEPDHNYSVEFVIPNGWFATKQNIGNHNGKDSDADNTGKMDEGERLYSGENTYKFDMGIYQKASLGDRVWIDKNGNGIQDNGELNVTSNDINVTLYSTTLGEVNSTLATNGEYLFSGLNPDSYYVIFDKSTLPTEYVFTEANISNNTNDLFDSDVNRTTGKSDTLFLSSGEDNRSIDAGIYKAVDIGDRIWHDIDANGVQDGVESNSSEVVHITLVDINGLEANRTIDSNSSGYLFKNVRPGSYYIDFVVPSQYEISPKNTTSDGLDSDINPSTHRTANFDVVSNEDDFSIDMGIYQNISIGDRIWYDTNMNGIQDVGENNLSVAVTVELWDEDGTLVDTNITTNGEYLFTDFIPSNYYLKFTLPDNYAISPKNSVGSDDNNDSDINSTMKTDIIIMDSNAKNFSVDVGMYELASIGNRIWLDSNANGIQDIDENNVNEDINVTLYYDSNGSIARSEIISDGSYHFTGLIPTDYNLSFSVPTGYFISPQDVGVDSNDTDVNSITLRTITTNLETGENDLSWDMGIYQKASLGNRVWYDDNGDGVQNSGELNVTDVNVTLYDGLGNELSSMKTVDGAYLFDELVPDSYYVIFDKATLPTGYIFTEQNITGSSELEDSDANTTTGISDIIELSSNEHNRSLDAGIYKPINLGDRIWEDTNADGIQDVNEKNTTQSITVTLYDTNHREANKSATVTNGDYLFTNVRPGNYQVEFSLPTGYKISYENSGSDDLIDNDVNPTTKITQAFDLTSNINDLSQDMGIYQDASLGDRVWIDANGNGVQDNNELNVSGVTVKLHLVSDDSEVQSTTTNADGEYLFEHIRPQSYYVLFSDLDTNYIFTLANQENNNSVDSDVDENGKSEEITLISNEHNRSIDAGIVLPITIGDKIWVDTNANGVQDLGEGNYSENLEVKLYYENNDSIYKTITATNGEYEFTNVIPDNYYIGFEIPTTYYTSPKNIGNDINNDSDTNSAGFTAPFSIHSGDNNLTLDMGIYQKASLGNRVWIDANGNGLQDNGEINATDVNVTLYSTTYLDVNITQETNSSGYLFKDLKPGDYYVVFDNRTLPSDIYIFTEQDRLNDDTIDSDVNATTGISDTLFLSSGDNNLTIDAGIYEPVVKVGDRIWEDANANGIQDIGEGNYIGGNITITLVDNNGLEPNVTILTNDGNYTFTKVRPGNYHLEFTLPTNYHISFKDNTDNHSDSDIDPITKRSDDFDIVSGIDDLSWDMGIYQNASLGDRIWIDNDGDGLQGIGELNISESIDVTLYYENNKSVAQIVTTTNGEYQFDNLIPEKYYVMFSDLNTSYRFTVKDSGEDANDSDVNATGYSDAFELKSDEHNRSVDVGILLPVSIGDRIWLDANANGVQDVSEINTNEEINVTLYYDGNKSIARTLTTTDGNYLFNNLNPQRYYIGFELPEDYYVSPKARATDNNNSDVNGDGFTDSFAIYSGDNNLSIDMGIYEKASIGDEIWYDINMDGIRDVSETGVSVPVLVKLFDVNGSLVATQNSVNGVYRFIDLIPSGYIVEFELPNNYALSPMNVGGDDATDSDVNVTTMRSDVIKISDSGDVDLSIDMGIYELASIGDRIWLDANANGVQDSDESNYIGSISVALYNASGTLISRKNISNGVYLFDELEPDDYYIQFSLPSGYILSDRDVSSDGVDSDVGVSNLRTISTNLAPAENDMSWDMGIYQPVSIGDRVWLDANADGVQDEDEQNYDGDIMVELYKMGVKIQEITINDGEYLFSGLRPSEYSIKVILPDGYYLSPQGMGDDNSSDSDMGVESFESDTVVLSSGANLDNLDIGIYQFGSIGDRIWYDTNMNGIQDLNESGVDENISVRLYNSDNKKVREVYSNNGVYLFDDLIPDGYSVEFELIDGYIVTKANRGSYEIDSDVGANMRSGEMMLRSGEDNRSIDMGVYESVSIGDRIWLDVNGNGLQDDDELNFEMDMVVQLYSSDDNLIREITVSDGVYLFDELEPNEYYIKVELPDGYVITKQNVGDEDNQTINSDVNASSMRSDMILLNPADANMSIDIGVYQLASIGDEIWLDENANGVQDNGESGVNIEIEVVLYDINGSEVDRLITVTGDYMFSDVKPSSYFIKFIVDDGYLFSNIGNDGVSDIIEILSGEKNEVMDIGIYLINNEILENSIDALDDEVSTLKDKNISIPVMNNDYDLNGDEFEIIRFDENSSGGGVISKDGDNLVYVPKDGFIGLDMFKYEIIDSNGLRSEATVRVNVLELSSFPIAFDDKFVTDMDVSLEIDILGNDIHTMDENISLLSVENSASGSVEILDNGLVKYVPNNGFSGVDRFSYVIIDDDGDESKAVVTVIVTKPIIEQPKIVLPPLETQSVPIAKLDRVSTYEFTSVVIDLLSNDSHTTGDKISLVDVEKPSNGILILKDNGTIIYIPNIGFSGDDRFYYTIEDSDGDRDTAVVIITVIKDKLVEAITPKVDEPNNKVIETPIEDNITKPDENKTIELTPTTPTVPALAIDDECGEFVINDDFFEGLRDEVAHIDVFENDILVGNQFDYDSLIFIDENDELVSIIEIANEGIWSIDNEKGLIIFTPIEGFKGMATEIKYIVNTLNGCKPITGGATIYVSYPEVKDDVIELPEDAVAGKDSVTVDIFANDPIKDPVLSTLQIKGTDNPGDSLIVEGEGTWIINEDKITFTPFDGFLGDPTPIEYIVKNHEGESTNYGKVEIHYPIKARDDIGKIDPGVPVTIDILSDDNGNLDKTSVILLLPKGFSVPGTEISTDGKTITVPREGTWQVNENGTVTFTPDPLLVGSPTPIEYSVFNKDGDKVAGAKITVECLGCICEGQIDSADSSSGLSIILLMLLTLLLVGFVSKKEEI